MLCRGIRDTALQKAKRQDSVRALTGATASLLVPRLLGCQNLSSAMSLSSFSNCQQADAPGRFQEGI